MSKKKILVVDDQIGIRLLLTDILTNNGFEVEEATTGKEAIDKIESSTYDLVILDYKLPIMDGSEILERLEAGNVQLKVIVMSGLIENISDEIERYSIVKKTLAKPFNINEFIEEVNKILALT